ncbi:ribosome silencing factor [Latilactobacillus fuchuensis]|uniref:ribosome silencing factor n=1 Tax=Latilactobacillus fuchuensis TaxID=164393 RepID=UPI0018EC6C3A|nr:ribosome silencing factor [Latilactobacillus fuchuensis]
MPGCPLRNNKGELLVKSLEMLEIAVKAADSKRAEDIVALNMEGISLLADYFVMLTGSSERQLKAIVTAIEDAEEENGVFVKSIEGKKGSRWILMDFGDLVINAFMSEERDLYQLEELWDQAPKVDVADWITAE